MRMGARGVADYDDPTGDALANLRNDYSEDEAGWKPVRDEGRTDIRYVAGDAWDPPDRAERIKNARLCLTFDEFSQYTNQLVNDSLQNKRAVKVTANGNGADDKEAELRANRIRQIEYRSNAQQAYTTAFENTVQRSFGWVRIISKYVNNSKREQELIIHAVPNPDMVTPGPHVMPDGSDIQRLWFHEQWSHKEFLRKFPKAKIRDFSSNEWIDLAPAWIQRDRIMVCEYWTKDEDGNVLQRITNGVEVLGTTPWAGKDIPFVPCYGKVLFTQFNGKTEREIHSLIRLAREPFKAYCYVRTCEAELIAQMPKFPYFVRRGSLTPQSLEALVRSVSEPVAVIEVEALLAEMSGTGPPEFPVRNPYDPTALAGLEAAAEAFRRAIQAAIGQSALPTQAQRRNEKSGVALKQIEDSGQRGSFHFLAHYEAMITRVGLLLNDLLKPIHDTPRDMTIRKPDDTTQVVRINDPNWRNPEKNDQPEHLQFTDGDFDVTISTGPQNDSEREAQSDFADLLIGNPQFMQLAGQNAPKIMAQAIRLRNVGPLGDAIADLLDPPQQQVDPQQQQQQMAKAQQLMEAQTKQIEALTHQIQTEQVKAQAQIDLQYVRNAGAIEVAKIAAMAKGIHIQTEADEEMIALGMEQQHEATQNEQDRQHEAAMAAMQGQQQAQQTDQQGAQQAQQSAQDHQQQLEQGAAGHEQQLQQGAQAAALAPQPEA